MEVDPMKNPTAMTKSATTVPESSGSEQAPSSTGPDSLITIVVTSPPASPMSSGSSRYDTRSATARRNAKKKAAARRRREEAAKTQGQKAPTTPTPGVEEMISDSLSQGPEDIDTSIFSIHSASSGSLTTVDTAFAAMPAGLTDVQTPPRAEEEEGLAALQPGATDQVERRNRETSSGDRAESQPTSSTPSKPRGRVAGAQGLSILRRPSSRMMKRDQVYASLCYLRRYEHRLFERMIILILRGYDPVRTDEWTEEWTSLRAAYRSHIYALSWEHRERCQWEKEFDQIWAELKKKVEEGTLFHCPLGARSLFDRLQPRKEDQAALKMIPSTAQTGVCFTTTRALQVPLPQPQATGRIAVIPSYVNGANPRHHAWKSAFQGLADYYLWSDAEQVQILETLGAESPRGLGNTARLQLEGFWLQEKRRSQSGNRTVEVNPRRAHPDTKERIKGRIHGAHSRTVSALIDPSRGRDPALLSQMIHIGTKRMRPHAITPVEVEVLSRYPTTNPVNGAGRQRNPNIMGIEYVTVPDDEEEVTALGGATPSAPPQDIAPRHSPLGGEEEEPHTAPDLDDIVTTWSPDTPATPSRPVARRIAPPSHSGAAATTWSTTAAATTDYTEERRPFQYTCRPGSSTFTGTIPRPSRPPTRYVHPTNQPGLYITPTMPAGGNAINPYAGPAQFNPGNTIDNPHHLGLSHPWNTGPFRG